MNKVAVTMEEIKWFLRNEEQEEENNEEEVDIVHVFSA